MTTENAIVLVNNVAVWSNATAVFTPTALQILIPNGTGGSDVVATFSGSLISNYSGATQIVTSVDGITDQTGSQFNEIRIIPKAGGCGCGRR